MSTSDRSADQRRRNESFLEEMTAWVAARGSMPADAFRLEVRAAAGEYEARCAHYATDGPSSDIVAQVALVTATHDVLVRHGVSSASVHKAMVDALALWVRQNAQAYSLARLGISRDEPEQAFQRAQENFKARGEERFGSHFEYEQEVSDEDRSFVNIKRCLYNELGRFLGKPEVTPVFCAMDTIWAEDATRAPYNLAFERPTTLAAGGDMCRFQFSRVRR